MPKSWFRFSEPACVSRRNVGGSTLAIRQRFTFLSWILILGIAQHSLPGQEPSSPSVLRDHTDVTCFDAGSGKPSLIQSEADWIRRCRDIQDNVARVMGELPERSGLPRVAFEILETQLLDGSLVRQKIRYATDLPERVPGSFVTAYLFLPSESKSRRCPAVLCLHQTNAMGKEEPAGISGKQNLSYALELAQRGYVTLAPDYPSFGEYSYDFAENADWPSGSLRAVWDNMRGIDLLQQLDEVAKDRIGCIGHSLGGHNAIFTAFHDPRIQATVSSCGFTRFHKYYQGDLTGWTSLRYMPRIAQEFGNSPDRVPFDFPELVASLAPRAFFTSSPVGDGNFEVSGVRDTIASAQRIYHLLNADAKLQAIYPDCEHDFPPEARLQAYAFLDEQLR
jgi:pimeloyl-ACP methyl ester carboxylesterase